MKISTLNFKKELLLLMAIVLTLAVENAQSQTIAFPGAKGFGRYAQGARASSTKEVYIVTNLNDSGTGSFRDAVSKPGRIVVFTVGGIIRLLTDVVVSPNVTIAGQTAPGDGVVFFNKRVTFTGANNVICRYLRFRLGATGNSGKDVSGLANGANMIFDHMSFTWAMDEVFSINWDGKGNSPDNITVQNSIIGQGLHRENHSAGGLIQTPDGGKVSLLQNLYISNKTRNPKVKGVNEFVNNVVYNWGNGNRLGDNLNYGWQGDAYIMGGSSGVSEVNIINNYFVGGPLTPPSKTTPFSRGTGTFNVFGSGNYFDNNKNGMLDGSEVPFDSTGYPGISGDAFKSQAFPYPSANPLLSAAEAYQYVIDNVGANYPRRDQVDGLMVNEVKSRGTEGLYVYRETDLPLSNGGVGDVFGAPAPLDSDSDGMPDAWEDANGLNKNDKKDAIAFNTAESEYLNIEVYVNSLINTPAPDFIKPPSDVTLSASSQEVPYPASTIDINWKDNSDNESNFVIERSQDGISYIDIFHPAANAQSYTDTVGVYPNRTYYYRIRSTSSTEVSAYSSPKSILTPPIASAPQAVSKPGPVNEEQYATPVAGIVTLKWTGSTNTTQYALYFGSDTSNLVKQAEIAYVASPSYKVTVNNGSNYFWRVDAINEKGIVAGPIWSFRTPPVIPAGLVGHWAFDESIADETSVIDSSSYQNHGVLGLDADDEGIRIKGKLKNALDFATANTNMYVVQIPNEDQLHLDRNSFSISFWMKANPSLLPPDNNTSSYLLCKGSISRNAKTGATGKRFDIEFKNKQIRFALDDDNDATGGGKDELQASGTLFFTGNWVHVVAIRDVENKRLRIYKNGVLHATSTISRSNGGIGEASALILGNIGELEFLAGTNKPAPYKGMLDEVRIYNKVLSPSEITELASVKNIQSITFERIPEKTLGEPDFAISATASSGLDVTFSSSDSTVATVENGIVHLIGLGSTVISASQAGNDNYGPAKADQVLRVVRDSIAPTIPANLSASATDSTVTLSWNSSSDNIAVKGYRVYKDGIELAILSADSSNVIISGLTASTTYSFSVNAFDNAGNVSELSTIAVTTPDTQAPTAPSALIDNKTNKHKVELSWQPSTDNVGVIGYNIYQNGALLNTSLITETGYLAERPIGHNVFEFVVKAVDAAGNSSFASNAVRVQNGQAGDKNQAVLSEVSRPQTDFLSLNKTEDLVIYPIPNKGNFKVNINSGENGIITISVFNTAGVLVYTAKDLKEGNYQREFQLSGLPAGTYYVRAAINRFVSTKSIIIQ